MMPDIESIKQDLMKGRDGIIRGHAARALAKVGRPAVGILIDALKHESPGTRQNVAIALGDIGDPMATLPLVDALHDVGWAAAKALGKIGDSRAEEALLKASRSSDSELRRAARDALAKIRDSGHVQAILRLIDQILTSSADSQVGEMLAFIGERESRPMRSYQQMEDAALELNRLQSQLTEKDRQYLNERLRELDLNEDWNVRRCAEIIRTGR